jgi:hypothetical protein
MWLFFGWFGVRLGLLKPDTPARFSLGSLIYFFFGLGVADLYNPGYFLSIAFLFAAEAEAIPLGEISLWYRFAASSPVILLGIGDLTVLGCFDVLGINCLSAFGTGFILGLDLGTLGLEVFITSSYPFF